MSWSADLGWGGGSHAVKGEQIRGRRCANLERPLLAMPRHATDSLLLLPPLQIWA